MTKPLTPEQKAENKRLKQQKLNASKKAPKKAAGKAAKEKPAKQAKATKPKADAPALGHNSGAVNEPLRQIVSEYLSLDQDAKAISKAKRDLRARAKEEHNVMASVFNHEIKLQKLDQQARVEFESGCSDLKNMLGIQLSLDLASDDTEEGEEGEEHMEGDGVPDPAEAARSYAASGVH